MAAGSLAADMAGSMAGYNAAASSLRYGYGRRFAAFAAGYRWFYSRLFMAAGFGTDYGPRYTDNGMYGLRITPRRLICLVSRVLIPSPNVTVSGGSATGQSGRVWEKTLNALMNTISYGSGGSGRSNNDSQNHGLFIVGH